MLLKYHMALLHTDVCIIGNELSGFIAGALLAQQGHRVVLIDNMPAYETKMLGDYYAPTFPYIWQIPKIGPAANVFDTLELRTELRQSFGSKNPLALVYDPHERLILSPQKQKLNVELFRAFGEPANKLAWNFSQLNVSSKDPLFTEATLLNETSLWGALKAKNRTAKALQAAAILGASRSLKLLLNPPLLEFLSPLHLFLQYQSLLPLESIGGLLALKAFQNGYHLPILEHASSYAILKSIFAEFLLRHGGEVIQDQSILQIRSNKKQITEINLNGLNNYIPDVVIDATYSKTIGSLFADSSLAKQLKSHENLVRCQGQTTIYRFLLPKSLLSKAIPPITASLHFENEEENKSIMGIFQPWKHPSLHQTTDKQSEAGLVIIVLATWHHNTDVQLGLRILKNTADRLLPFARNKRLIEDVITHEEANWIWPQYLGEKKGLNRLLGRPIQTPISNLIRAGRDVAPALGIDGEIVSAQAVFNAALTSIKKKDRILLGKRN